MTGVRQRDAVSSEHSHLIDVWLSDAIKTAARYRSSTRAAAELLTSQLLSVRVKLLKASRLVYLKFVQIRPNEMLKRKLVYFII